VLQLQANCIIMAFVVLYLGYAAICQAALLVLKTEPRTVTEIGNTLLVSLRMEADYSIATSDELYRFVLQPSALAFLLTYGIGIPILLFYSMRSRKDQLFEGDRITEIFGFMIQGYAYDRYWWEIVVMVRKLLVSIIVVFLAKNTANQSFALIFVTDVALVLGVYLKPFRSNIAQAFETLSLSVIHLTLVAGLLLDTDLTSDYSVATNELKNIVVSWVTLALNAMMILSILATFAWDFLKEKSMSDLIQENYIYMKIQAARTRREVILGPTEFSKYHNVMSLADFKQRSGGVILFQKKRSGASVSSISSSSSRASSVDEEKGNIHRKSKSSQRIPTIEEDIVFDFVLDAPAPSNVTNIYSETQLWGAERAPPVAFESVPKLDLTGIESDSSESSVEAHFASRFESELSLPILQSIIPMDVTEVESLLPLAHLQSQANLLYPEYPTTTSSSTDASLSQASGDDDDFSDGSSQDSIEISAFESENPRTSMPPLKIEALLPPN